jgi:hypothetical protein
MNLLNHKARSRYYSMKKTTIAIVVLEDEGVRMSNAIVSARDNKN